MPCFLLLNCAGEGEPGAGVNDAAVRRQSRAVTEPQREAIPLASTKKKALASASAFFSYIRLWRVILLRSDIRLRRVILRCAQSEGEYNITFRVSEKYHVCRKADISHRAKRDISLVISQ
jgi:hypothetical protein